MDLSAFSAFHWTARSANHSSHGFLVAFSLQTPPRITLWCLSPRGVSFICLSTVMPPQQSLYPSPLLLTSSIQTRYDGSDHYVQIMTLDSKVCSRKRIYHLAIPGHSDIKNATGAETEYKMNGWHSFLPMLLHKSELSQNHISLCSGPFTVNRESKIFKKKSLMARVGEGKS